MAWAPVIGTIASKGLPPRTTIDELLERKLVAPKLDFKKRVEESSSLINDLRGLLREFADSTERVVELARDAEDKLILRYQGEISRADAAQASSKKLQDALAIRENDLLEASARESKLSQMLSEVKVSLEKSEMRCRDFQGKLDETRAMFAKQRAELEETKLAITKVQELHNDTSMSASDLSAQLASAKVEVEALKAQLKVSNSECDAARQDLAVSRTNQSSTAHDLAAAKVFHVALNPYFRPDPLLHIQLELQTHCREKNFSEAFPFFL